MIFYKTVAVALSITAFVAPADTYSVGCALGALICFGVDDIICEIRKRGFFFR